MENAGDAGNRRNVEGKSETEPDARPRRMIGEFPFVWLNGDGGEETSLLECRWLAGQVDLVLPGDGNAKTTASDGLELQFRSHRGRVHCLSNGV
jgi:hypothetical protein